jgi:hypothetical protein
MDEPSQSQVDLSDIHPLKLVTLIAIRYVAGLSIFAAIYSTQRGGEWQKQIDDARTKILSVYPKLP